VLEPVSRAPAPESELYEGAGRIRWSSGCRG
jgi:hypothetical protein